MLEQLKSLPDDKELKADGVSGTLAAKLDTPAGAIIIGGKGQNTYQLDKMRDVACVIDLGGNDTYADGTSALDRPVLVVIDLAGNDIYRGSKPGIQGGAVLGVSMLLDLGGRRHVSGPGRGPRLGAWPASASLIDYAGNDATAACAACKDRPSAALGILIDRGGNDDYHAAMWAQGFGGPLGFGLLDDLDGNDHYYCGGMWRDSYPETPGWKAGAKASAPASGRWPTAASA